MNIKRGVSITAANFRTDRRAWLYTHARVLAVILISTLPIVPSLASAQSDAESSGRSDQLSEVIVTARKVKEDAQKVPVTVQVISEDALKQQNIASIADLQYLVPGLAGITNTTNAIRLTLRGQGALGNLSYPGVIFFENGVPVPWFGGGGQNSGPGMFFDVENVQVLKGPQGTLFGLGSAGGDILVNSVRPSNAWGGYVDVGVGNYNDREFDTAFNVPIIPDVLLARIAYTSQTRDGYTQILGTPSNPQGIDGDNRDTHSLRATVTFKPTDWVSDDLIWSDERFSGRGVFGVMTYLVPGGQFVTQYPGVAALFAEQQALGIRTVIPISVDPVADGYSKSLTNITLFTLGDNITIKNIFGYDEENNTFAGDQDNTIYPWYDVYSYPYSKTIWQYSDELQLQGSNFNNRFNWIVGYFYLTQPEDLGDPSAYSVAQTYIEGAQGYAVGTSGYRSHAVYGHLIYDLSDFVHGLSVNGGLRRATDSYSNHSWGGAGVCEGSAYSCIGGITPSVGAGSSNATTWSAGVQEQITDKTMVYVTSSKGYRPGGANGFSTVVNEELPTFGPEYVLETDLGIKSDWKIGNMPLRTNVALWHQDYSNIQEQVIHPIAQGGAYTQNAGSANFNGYELEAWAFPTPHMQVGANFAHISKHYTNFLPGVGTAAIAQLNATKTLGDPPEKLNAFVRYQLPVSSKVGEIFVRADYNWQAASGWLGIPDNLGVQNAFGLLNLSATWNGVYDKPYDVELWMSNATNRVYATQAVQAWMPEYLGYGDTLYGEPRMYGLRVKYHFGEE